MGGQYATYRVPATPWGAVWWWLRVRCWRPARDVWFRLRPPAEDPVWIGRPVVATPDGVTALRNMTEGERGVVLGSEVANGQRLYHLRFPHHDVRTPLPNPHFEVLR